jgi:hypothetical protein
MEGVHGGVAGQYAGTPSLRSSAWCGLGFRVEVWYHLQQERMHHSQSRVLNVDLHITIPG